MAAMRDTSDSQMNAGDEYFEFSCTPCDKKNLNKKASVYCTSCRQSLCVTCTEYHSNFPALDGHTLLDSNVKRPPTNDTERKYHAAPTELCKRHRKKCVDMYCGSHDTVGCYLCMKDHKSCDHIYYIPYMLLPVSRDQTKHIRDQLASAIKTVGGVKAHQAKFNATLEACRTRCTSEINSYRNEINYILDNLERDTLQDLEDEFEDKAKSAKKITQNARSLLNDMIRFKSEIESGNCNDSQKFVIAKLIVSMIAQGMELVLQARYDLIAEITFTTDPTIKTFLSSLVQLGTIQNSEKQPIVANDANENNMRPPASRLTPIAKKNTHSKNDVCYQMMNKKEYSVKLQDEKNTCNICSCCILDSGDILMTDNLNFNLKLMDGKTYLTKSSLVLHAKPWSVCRVNGSEAAVCLNNSTIQIVSTRDTLTPLRSISTSFGHKAIAVAGDRMYVSCNGHQVQIYTLSGRFLNTFSKDTSGNDIFSDINDIAIWDEKRMIHVADSRQGVITLDTGGNVVWKYSDEKLQGSLGLCTDGNGNVFVCGHSSNNVIQLDTDGQYLGEVISASKDVNGPNTVCYKRKTRKLIVGKMSDNINVVRVQQL